MKIIADDNIPYLRGRLEPVADVEYVDQHGFTPEIVKDADALLIRTRTQCNKALLEGSNVKLVATATIGTDQIDIPWCESAGIEVKNSPGCNAPGVAQYVWASLLRMGFEPGKHTLGVVGRGNVGEIVAEWGKRLGAKVYVCDPPRRRRGIADNYLPLERIMAECDAITLHTPLTLTGADATHHLLNNDMLKLLKPGAMLVNAARGPVVDFKALRPYVMEGKIRCAIDTWEWEPKVDSELLSNLDFGTFHIAGYSRQGKERATRMVLEAVEEKFGISVDKSGLALPYTPPSRLSPAIILESYNPAFDTESLRRNPEAFDMLRRNYNYREEIIN